MTRCIRIICVRAGKHARQLLLVPCDGAVTGNLCSREGDHVVVPQLSGPQWEFFSHVPPDHRRTWKTTGRRLTGDHAAR